LGIEDTLGVEWMMYAALDTVEKKLGKPLTTSDTQGLAAIAIINFWMLLRSVTYCSQNPKTPLIYD